MTTTDADWLDEAARYFEKRPTGGEDMAFWSNVTNAERCRKIAQSLRSGNGGEVRVLEWEETFRDGTFYKLRADTPFGAYEVSSEFSFLSQRGQQVHLPTWKGPMSTASEECVSVDAAKAGAQADYEQRILSALDIKP